MIYDINAVGYSSTYNNVRLNCKLRWNPVSMRSWSFASFDLPQKPQIIAIVLLNNGNLSFFLM